MGYNHVIEGLETGCEKTVRKAVGKKVVRRKADKADMPRIFGEWAKRLTCTPEIVVVALEQLAAAARQDLEVR